MSLSTTNDLLPSKNEKPWEKLQPVKQRHHTRRAASARRVASSGRSRTNREGTSRALTTQARTLRQIIAAQVPHADANVFLEESLRGETERVTKTTFKFYHQWIQPDSSRRRNTRERRRSYSPIHTSRASADLSHGLRESVMKTTLADYRRLVKNGFDDAVVNPLINSSNVLQTSLAQQQASAKMASSQACALASAISGMTLSF